MPVPRIKHSAKQPVSRLAALLTLLLLSGSVPANARGPEPPQRIPLASLGFQPFTQAVLAAGGTLSTVHFIDDEHLLVTFNVRRLMKRLADEPADDQDRTVEAVIVHLSSGKVLARTQWRVHDPGQYLWPLGHGRFLLRIRDTLTTLAPVANLHEGDPFEEKPFLRSDDRRIVALLLSPDRDLVTVETMDRPAVKPGADPASSGSTNAAPAPVSRRTQLNFYRLVLPSKASGALLVQSAGIASAREPVDLSLTSAGYIEVLQESPNRWLFDFDSYAGSFKELAPYDSTCRPHPVFVSAAEFVALSCLGSNDKIALGGFNLRGEQMWQQNFSDIHAFPNYAFAPAAGRFAFSRNIVPSNSGITVDFAPSTFTTQQIRVYQSYNGKQLLQLEASPVQRSGQNYDLSADGMRLAIIRADAVEVYRLPPLSRTDEMALRTSQTLQPEDTQLPVNLASHLKPKGVPSGPAPVTATAAPQPLAPEATPPNPSAAGGAQNGTASAGNNGQSTGNVQQNGDSQPGEDTPRKPPTLYTLPTDKQNEPSAGKPQASPHP